MAATSTAPVSSDRLHAVAADPADAEEADAGARERCRARGVGERRRHARVTSALRKPSGPVARGVERLAEPVEREACV